MEPKRIIVYTEAFKRKVISEIKSGKFKSFSEAAEFHHINGSTTIRKWIKKFGEDDLLPKRIIIDV